VYYLWKSVERLKIHSTWQFGWKSVFGVVFGEKCPPEINC
jgi:hypothetical protein